RRIAQLQGTVSHGIDCIARALFHGLINGMKVTEILRAWMTILAGRAPSLSVEITKECPLTCPGCYAYGGEHLGGEIVLRQVSDYQGGELVHRLMNLVDAHQPLHPSIVWREP